MNRILNYECPNYLLTALTKKIWKSYLKMPFYFLLFFFSSQRKENDIKRIGLRIGDLEKQLVELNEDKEILELEISHLQGYISQAAHKYIKTMFILECSLLT